MLLISFFMLLPSTHSLSENRPTLKAGKGLSLVWFQFDRIPAPFCSSSSY